MQLNIPNIHGNLEAPWNRFPNTRYLGSKRKLLPFLQHTFSRLEFDTALDPFSGTASVAYLLKTLGKEVTAADSLNANTITARALVENDMVTLEDDIDTLLDGLPQESTSPGFVERTFEEIFFETHENRFIDGVLERIKTLSGYKKDIALYCLFQACLVKRPYNLFHRANLNMRRRNVKRSFGNKKTWDTPFYDLMKKYCSESSGAIFDTKKKCRALCSDVFELDPLKYDLVYLDPPYVSSKGSGVDYLDFYHFLEGLAAPAEWEHRILHRYKHKPLEGRGRSPWCDPKKIGSVFQKVIEHFACSQIVISYRSDGIPSADEICTFLKKSGKRVSVLDGGKYTYALSRNRSSREMLFVGASNSTRILE